MAEESGSTTSPRSCHSAARIALLVAVGGAEFFAPQGVAADEHRFYVGGSGSYAAVNGRASADRTWVASPGELPTAVSIDGLVFDDEDFAWSALAGYFVGTYLAVEAGYADLGKFDLGGTFLARPDMPRLAIEEWYLAARFAVPVYKRLAANWHLGVSRASFGMTGSVPVLSLFPFPVVIATIPFAVPDDETGFLWGFGFSYALTDRLDLGVNYRRHDTQVIDAETAGLEVTFSF